MVDMAVRSCELDDRVKGGPVDHCMTHRDPPSYLAYERGDLITRLYSADGVKHKAVVICVMEMATMMLAVYNTIIIA